METSGPPLEKAIFAVPPRERNSKIVARHYGFDGRGGANFQRIGREFGLSRERVRQIVSASDPLGQVGPTAGRALQRVLDFLENGKPGPAAEIEAGLQREGLTAGRFRIEGVSQLAGLLDLPVSFRIGLLNRARFLLPCSGVKFLASAGRARQEVRRNGMTTIARLIREAGLADYAQSEGGILEAILVGQPDFQWLDRRSGWFWLTGTRRNRAVIRVRKMLAVASALTVAEIHAGLARMGTPLPAESVLLEFCRQLEGVRVDGNLVRASPRIEPSEVLNKTEREIYRLLLENGGCLPNSDLIRQTSRTGMKRPTFYQCVTNSPIVERFHGSHYGLIGWQRRAQTERQCETRVEACAQAQVGETGAAVA